MGSSDRTVTHVTQRTLVCLALVTIALGIVGLHARAQQNEETETEAESRSILEGVYSKAQANRGAEVFQTVCQDCHMPEEFVGSGYIEAWSDQTVLDLFEAIRTTMPEDNPGRLRRRAYADILAYIFDENGIPSGDIDLPDDDEALQSIRIEAPADASADDAPRDR